jgi:LAO/AO transport system kinase
MSSEELVADLLDGDHRALARVISNVENRTEGYRDVVSALHDHTGSAEVIGITGSPGAGKSTLVDKLAAQYRERDLTVGVVAIDPSSPFTGGSVLGDRIRMGSTTTDMDVFVRSMSARGSLGGLATATTDAVTALDAFGKDRIIIETVGAGQNEVDVVRTADTVAVIVPPGSGDDVQMLKAGILEIADLFVVNKADLDGADRTVQELREMLDLRSDDHAAASGHHGAGETAGTGEGDVSTTAAADDASATAEDSSTTAGDTAHETWTPPIVETVATSGEGVADLLDALDDHRRYLVESGRLETKTRTRYAAEIRTLLREDANDILTDEIEARGGIDELVDAVIDGETDPYRLVDDIVDPLGDCVRERR